MNKTPTEVAIDLDESPNNVERYFADYWRLERMNSLYKIYIKDRDAIPNLIRIYKLLSKKNILSKRYKEVIDLLDEQMRQNDKAHIKWNEKDLEVSDF